MINKTFNSNLFNPISIMMFNNDGKK